MQSEVFPLPGAAQLIRTVARSPHRVALASSGDPEFTDDALALLGIADAIELVTSAEDAEISKPAPDLLRVALDRMGSVESAVFVGDTPYDVEAATRAGLRCVTVRTGGFSAGELHEAGADLVVESAADLLELDWSRYLN